MTDENKFFRYVWRFNAVALAAVGILATFAMLNGIINSWSPPEPKPAGRFAPVPRSAEKEFTYRLESHGERRLIGPEELIALDRWKGSPETYGLMHQEMRASYIAQSRSVNLLAIDQGTAESHWIFRGYDRAIIADDPIYDTVAPRPLETPPASTIALVMTVVDSDTNKDGELTEKDQQSLYVYRPGATEVVRLVTAGLILSRQQTSSDRYLVVYENGSSATAATFSVPEFKLVAEKLLPKVPNG